MSVKIKQVIIITYNAVNLQKRKESSHREKNHQRRNKSLKQKKNRDPKMERRNYNRLNQFPQKKEPRKAVKLIKS